MGTLESHQAAQLLKLEDCDRNIQVLWEGFRDADTPKKKEKYMKEIDSWLETRLFVSQMEGGANGLH